MLKSPKTSRMQESYWVNYYRLVSMTRFAATVRAGPARAAITCHGQGSPSSCKDDVGSLRGVLATSSRPCRMQASEEEVSSVLRCYLLCWVIEMKMVDDLSLFHLKEASIWDSFIFPTFERQHLFF